jgi:predicted  nucleic acid-binding Zn-ribbon protein
MADIAKLYDLQKVDTLSERIRRRLAQLRPLLAESDELKEQRNLVASLEASQQKSQTTQRDAELEAQSLTNRIKATDERLMSGQVRNPKELASLQENIAALRRQREAVENTGMEALLEVEELTGTLAEARARLQEVESRWQVTQAELLQEEAKLKKAFAQCKRQREQLVAALPATLLTQYNDLRQRKAGIALATIDRNLCTACHVAVPTGVISAARNQSGNFAFCPSCGRILYVA